MRLDKRCNVCGSSVWCGRKCAAGPAMDSYPPVTKRNKSVTQAKQDVTASNESVTLRSGIEPLSAASVMIDLYARVDALEARLVALEANDAPAFDRGRETA